MKKRFLVLLLAVSLLAGCGGKQPPVERPEREETEAPWTESDRVYDDSLLTEFTYEETIGEGDSEIHISYTLPQLLDDTPDAENINQLFRWYQQEAEESEYPTFESITWEGYWNGSLLSILLTAQPLGQGETNYLPVNYDFAEGREVPPWEVPQWVGLSEDEALAALRRTAAQEFDSFMAETLDSCGDCFDDVLKLRAATLSESTLNLATTMLYLDDMGELNASLTLYTLSGGGYHYLTAPVRVPPEDWEVREETYANVMVEDTGAGLQVTFREWDENSRMDAYLDGVEPGVAYPIEGFYGDVRDMALSKFGGLHEIYLVVVDQEGQLSYCDMSLAAMHKSGFRMTPLQNPRHVVSLTAEPDDSEIYAVTEDGESLSFFENTVMTEYEVPGILDGTLWMTEDGAAAVSMEMASNDMPMMQWSCDGEVADGFCFFEGVTEKGIHFHGNFQDRDLNNRTVSMTFSVPDWWDFSTSVMTLTFLDSGETLELTLAQG